MGALSVYATQQRLDHADFLAVFQRVNEGVMKSLSLFIQIFYKSQLVPESLEKRLLWDAIVGKDHVMIFLKTEGFKIEIISYPRVYGFGDCAVHEELTQNHDLDELEKALIRIAEKRKLRVH